MTDAVPAYYANQMGRNTAIAGGLGGLGAGLAGMFMGGGEDPSKEANKYFNQIPGAISPYYNPYMQAGQGAMGNLQGQYGQLTGGLSNLQGQYSQMAGMGQGIMGQYNRLMQDPTAVMNQIGAGYQHSPGYDWQMGQGMNAANNAAAAGGMIGTPQHQQQAATMATGLANQDYYNYMNHGLEQYGLGLQGGANMYGAGLQGQQGLYNSGLQGMQGINAMGYNASNEMGQNMGNALMNQGSLAYQGAANQNQSQGTEWGNIMGGLGTLAAFL